MQYIAGIAATLSATLAIASVFLGQQYMFEGFGMHPALAVPCFIVFARLTAFLFKVSQS